MSLSNIKDNTHSPYSLSRKAFFNCGYKDQEGHFVGKNYMLKVFLNGPLDEKNNMIVNLIDFKIILDPIIESIDHKFLNDDLEFFKTHPPDFYHVALYIFKELKTQILNYNEEQNTCLNLEALKLYENPKCWIKINE